MCDIMKDAMTSSTFLKGHLMLANSFPASSQSQLQPAADPTFEAVCLQLLSLHIALCPMY